MGMKDYLSDKVFVLKLIFCSLFYNSLCSWPLIIETFFEPFIHLCSRSFKYLGPIFIFLFVVLTTSVVVTFYTCLFPMKWQESAVWACIHFLAGHWILWNILFNYFKASFISPGYTDEDMKACRTWCKKCILPKPSRSHHCGVCRRCVLKMDHHCPWLNNCVGHQNHRYFFLFSMYMFIGCAYVSIVAFPLFKTHIRPFKSDSLFGLTLYQARPSALDSNNLQHIEQSFVSSQHHISLHAIVAFEFILCITASLALFGMLVWHCFLISRGETSIEVHTNRNLKSIARAQGKSFMNPHDHGLLNNWKIFFGLVNGKSFWRHMLLPSSHPAVGDGVHWRRKTVNRSFYV